MPTPSVLKSSPTYSPPGLALMVSSFCLEPTYWAFLTTCFHLSVVKLKYFWKRAGAVCKMKKIYISWFGYFHSDLIFLLLFLRICIDQKIKLTYLKWAVVKSMARHQCCAAKFERERTKEFSVIIPFKWCLIGLKVQNLRQNYILYRKTV